MKHRSIAIIPARGGSKRIPKKNVKDFWGKPIIQYSIEAAIKSKCFDVVMVSTDDKEIAEVAKSLGASVPFLRSEKTSGDHSGTTEVLEEVITEYKKIGESFDIIACIYATAPFVTTERLIEAMNKLINSDADSIVPVTRFSYPIQRALKIEADRIIMFWPENYSARSQDLTPAFHDCGQFFCIRTNSLLKENRIFLGDAMPFEIPESEVQDLDNEEDWKMAEMKYKFLKDNE